MSSTTDKHSTIWEDKFTDVAVTQTTVCSYYSEQRSHGHRTRTSLIDGEWYKILVERISHLKSIRESAITCQQEDTVHFEDLLKTLSSISLLAHSLRGCGLYPQKYFIKKVFNISRPSSFLSLRNIEAWGLLHMGALSTKSLTI